MRLNFLVILTEREIQPAERVLDYWDKLFFGSCGDVRTVWYFREDKKQILDRLCRIVIGRDERMLSLG